MRYGICLLFSCQLLIAGEFSKDANHKNFSFGNEGSFRPSRVAVQYSWEKYFHQGFQMKVWMANTMTLGCQAVAGQCGGIGPDGQTLFGLDYPVGSGIEHLFGAGPWIAGKINGSAHADEGYNGNDARTEFIPNFYDTLRDRIWITSTSDTAYDPNRPGYYKTPMNRRGYDDDHDGKVDEDELDGLDNDGDWNPLTDDIGADGVADTGEVGCKGVYDPVANPDPAYDNFSPTTYDSCHPNLNGSFRLMKDRNRYTEKNGRPDHGEPHVDEDYGAVSDQDVYLASTDTFRTPVITDHSPMGIKVFQKSYAWRSDYAGAILPMEYDFINVKRNTVTDVYIGFFADMDVGPYTVASYFSHNYAAYDSVTRTAYIANPLDRGSTPLGLALLGTTRSLDSLNFVFQRPGFSYPGTIDSLIYAAMSCQGYGDTACIASNQSPDSLSDARVFIAFGPFPTFSPGDTLTASFALVSGFTVPDMLNNAIRAHSMFGNNFILGVKEITRSVPSTFKLYQNYPNPFNPTTRIEFSLGKMSDVTLKVYDVLGREIRTLLNNRFLGPGRQAVEFDGRGLPSGVYFYRLETPAFSETKAMILTK